MRFTPKRENGSAERCWALQAGGPRYEQARSIPAVRSRSHGVAGGNPGHDGRIGNAKSIDATDPEIAIHDGHLVAAHLCRTREMPVGHGRDAQAAIACVELCRAAPRSAGSTGHTRSSVRATPASRLTPPTWPWR